jgi:hypothetical protein
MLITPEMHADYKKIKYKGSLQKVMKASRINDNRHMSSVMSRKKHTSINKVASIYKWIEKEKKRLAPILQTETDGN